MKKIIVNVDEDFLKKATKMLYFIKMTGNLIIEHDEFQRLGTIILVALEKNMNEIIITKEGKFNEKENK